MEGREGKHWKVVRMSEAVHSSMMKLAWSLKRKLLPSGHLTKHKARICAHGGTQRWGESHCENHAPILNCLSARFLLTVSIALDLNTRSIDFTLSFFQDELKSDVSMDIPYGHEIEGIDSTKAHFL